RGLSRPVQRAHAVDGRARVEPRRLQPPGRGVRGLGGEDRGWRERSGHGDSCWARLCTAPAGPSDIVVLEEDLHDALVAQVLTTLSAHRFRAQLQELGGYDTQHTADIVVTLEPGATTRDHGSMEYSHG